MKKKLLLLLLLCIVLVDAQKQVLPQFPEKQNFYEGGYSQFYKEAHNYLKTNNLKDCDNKNEAYLMRVLVNEDGSVNYIKDSDKIGVENNKCTFDLAVKILSNLKNFKPAELDGVKTPAIAKILFVPNELFSEDNYLTKKDLYKNPEFPGGIENYRKKFISCFDISGYTYNMDFKFVINFDVDTQGEIQNIYIDTGFANDRFLKMVLDCIVPRKLKFKPGSYNGTPVTMMFRLPVTIRTQ